MAEKDKDILENIGEQEYKYGFTSDIETETIGKGLSEDVVRLISAKKGEPAWMTERRVAAYRHWLTMEPPTWAHLTIPEIDFQDIIYYAAPKQQKKLDSMDEVDPELKRTFDKLGIPLEEQMALAGVAVDAVMDSVSVKTTFKEVLAEKGIIFCSISEALRDFPDLVKKYLGSVVPYTDNFYAALNAEEARRQGLGLNAGHDLNLENLRFFVSRIPWTDEVSIGHALICDALYYGLENTVQLYKRELR